MWTFLGGGGPTGANGTQREYIWLPEAEIAPTRADAVWASEAPAKVASRAQSLPRTRSGVDRPLAMIEDVETASPLTWYVLVDHLNRPIRMTDAAKAPVWNAVWTPRRMPRGHPKAQAEVGAPHSITGSATLDARFPGQWFQLEVGLHYNWHRHYDPTIGRYTQPDPLGFVDGLGVFGYTVASPLLLIDPLGLETGGHHWVSGPVRSYPGLSREAQNVFNRSVTGTLPGGHNYSTPHPAHNSAVCNLFERYCAANNIHPQNMTAQQATDFVRQVIRSNDPNIRALRNQVIRQIFRRVGPPRLE